MTPGADRPKDIRTFNNIVDIAMGFFGIGVAGVPILDPIHVFLSAFVDRAGSITTDDVLDPGRHNDL